MSYLTLNHNNRKKYIRATVKALKESGLDFQSIVCTGLSGLLVSPVIAERLDKQLVIVRKGESSHGSDIEMDWRNNIGNYVILDDFTESGETITRIRNKMVKHFPLGADCVGVYMYRQGSQSEYKKVRETMPQLWFGCNPR